MQKYEFSEFNLGLFWDIDTKKINFPEDKHFIIHRVLSYGTMDDIRSLFKIYGKEVIKKEFLNAAPGQYDPKVLALVQHILGVDKIDKYKYLRNLHGDRIKNPRFETIKSMGQN